MGIGPIAAITGAPLPAVATAPAQAAAPVTAPGGSSFASMLSSAIGSLNTLQSGADSASQQLAAGGTTDLATAVMAAEKANLSLQLAVEVRNRVVSGIQQLMQMQV